jgi:hypothetical protein
MAKVRDDLEGVVTAYDEGGVAVTLSAGDDIPAGVEVGDHVIGDAKKAPAKKAASSKTDN